MSIIHGGDKGPGAAATSLGQAVAPTGAMFSLASETAGPAEIPGLSSSLSLQTRY